MKKREEDYMFDGVKIIISLIAILPLLLFYGFTIFIIGTLILFFIIIPLILAICNRKIAISSETQNYYLSDP